MTPSAAHGRHLPEAQAETRLHRHHRRLQRHARQRSVEPAVQWHRLEGHQPGGGLPERGPSRHLQERHRRERRSTSSCCRPPCSPRRSTAASFAWGCGAERPENCFRTIRKSPRRSRRPRITPPSGRSSVSDGSLPLQGGVARQPRIHGRERFGTRRFGEAAETASSAGDELQPRRRMEGAHQQVHRDHSAQRRRILRGRAEHVRRAATENSRKQRHDGKGRRGREA